MFGTRSNRKIVALATIESGSAALALFATGPTPELLAYAREELPLEERQKAALRTSIVQALAAAGEKVLAEYSKAAGRERVSTCYCIVGAPWSRSFAGAGHSKLERPTAITDEMISALAKQALASQTEIEHANLLEANVSRVLLNGYPTSEPAGKHAESLDIYTLVSDCDPDLKTGALETLLKLFPGASFVWRSSARATLGAARELDPTQTCLIVQIDGEATDLISVHKGVVDQRIFLEQGWRQLLTTLAKGKPPQETIALMELIEKDECDDAACEELRQSIAKAEPELVHRFGEALAKLSSRRKLPEELVLIAPPGLSPWLSRFFARIDFTQFTAIAKPFSVRSFDASALSGMPHNDTSALSDPGLCIGLKLVNIELSS